MKRWVGVGLALGFGLGLAGAATVRTFRHGVYYVGEAAEERLDYSDVEDGARFSQGRSLGVVPASYGRLVGVTAGANGGALWFEDDEKTIRNVWVEEGRLVRLRRGGTYEDRP
jgi:hypothetical protein